MEQDFTSPEDAYAEGSTGYAGATPPHGRRPAQDDPTGMPERAGSEDDDAGDGDGDGEETVSVHRTACHGPVTVNQHITAGRNAFGVTGDAVIHVRNRD